MVSGQQELDPLDTDLILNTTMVTRTRLERLAARLMIQVAGKLLRVWDDGEAGGIDLGLLEEVDADGGVPLEAVAVPDGVGDVELHGGEHHVSAENIEQLGLVMSGGEDQLAMLDVLELDEVEPDLGAGGWGQG